MGIPHPEAAGTAAALLLSTAAQLDDADTAAGQHLSTAWRCRNSTSNATHHQSYLRLSSFEQQLHELMQVRLQQFCHNHNDSKTSACTHHLIQHQGASSSYSLCKEVLFCKHNAYACVETPEALGGCLMAIFLHEQTPEALGPALMAIGLLDQNP